MPRPWAFSRIHCRAKRPLCTSLRTLRISFLTRSFTMRGPRLINDATRAEMRKILGEIQDGTFTRELVEEFDAGQPNFAKRREAEQAEQIEQVGAKLRPLMSWLSDPED